MSSGTHSSINTLAPFSLAAWAAQKAALPAPIIIMSQEVAIIFLPKVGERHFAAACPDSSYPTGIKYPQGIGCCGQDQRFWWGAAVSLHNQGIPSPGAAKALARHAPLGGHFRTPPNSAFAPLPPG